MERNEENFHSGQMFEKVIRPPPFSDSLGQWNAGQNRPILGRHLLTVPPVRPEQEPDIVYKIPHEMNGHQTFRTRPIFRAQVPPQLPVRKKLSVQAQIHPGTLYCSFCFQNQETRQCWSSHKIKDRKTGIVTCPILRCHVCQFCGATGDGAHTEAYCPRRPIGTSVATALKMTPRNSTGLRNRNRF